jgi:hypothetical protein
MQWQQIASQADADYLMELFGGFHDGCIAEVHLWTGYYVSEDLRMAVPVGLDTSIRLLVHRQWTDPAAIELLFEQVTHFNFAPAPVNYESIIHTATLLFRGDELFWADAGGWDPNATNSDNVTRVSAKRLRWRDASEWLGDELRYGPGDAETRRRDDPDDGHSSARRGPPLPP